MRSLQLIEKFARSLFEYAKNHQLLLAYKQNAELLLVAYSTHQSFFDSLADNTVIFEKRQATFKNTIGVELESHLLASALLLIERDSFKYFRAILKKLLRLVNDELNVKTVVIRSAFALSDDQYDRLLNSLKKKYACEIEAVVEVDENLIGGLSVDFNSEVLDATVKTKLTSIIKNHNLHGGE